MLSERYLEATTNTFLFVPNKTERTSIEGLNSLFELKKFESHNGFKFFDIQFTGDPEQIRKDGLMILVDVSEYVNGIERRIKHNAELFIISLLVKKKIVSPLDKNCFKCEYNVDRESDCSGYKECWAKIKETEPHIKTLYHVGTIGGNKEPIVNSLIADRKVSLFDMPLDELKGKRDERQLIQIENTRTNTEWASTELRAEIDSWEYPFHPVMQGRTSIKVTLPAVLAQRPIKKPHKSPSVITDNQSYKHIYRNIEIRSIPLSYLKKNHR